MKKFYTYKIVNSKNDLFYVGMHYGRLNDRYLGSGNNIRSLIKELGRSNFKKEVVGIYDSLEECVNAEYSLIESVINDDNCLNIRLGNDSGWSNSIVVTPKNSNKKILIPLDKYYENRSKYTTNFCNKITVFDQELNSNRLVTLEEYDSNSNLIHLSSGKVNVKTIDGKSTRVTLSEYYSNKNKYIHNNSGKILFIHPESGRIKYFHKSFNKEGWVKFHSGKVNVYDSLLETGVMISTEEYYSNKDRYIHYNSKYSWMVNHNELTEKFVKDSKIDDMKLLGWELGKLPRTTFNNGKKNIKVLNHQVDSYLKKGWKLGGLTGKKMEYKSRTCTHCGVVGKGPNMTRYHFNNCKKNPGRLKITKIEVVELTDPVPVYDISMSRSNPSFSLDSGLVSHNTLRWSSAIHTVPSTLDYSLCYTPREDGKLFLSMDLAQAEVRIAFAVAKEQGLIDAIIRGLDIHGLNANNAFDLGFKEDELWKIKEDAKLDQLRNYAKMLTFSILYGASPGSIAKQIRKPLSEAQEIYDGYFKANPNFKKFIDDNQRNLKDNHGFITLPVFGHTFYIGNPYHYSIKQKGLNYIIQNLSSSICAHTAFNLYKDLKDNYDIELDLVTFVHDAIEMEIKVGDLFTVLDRIDYWYRIYPLETWNIPNDHDYELGSSRYSGGPCSYKWNEDKSELDFNLVINDYYDDKEMILSNLRSNYEILEESIEESGRAYTHPFKFMIEGVRPACRFNEVVTPQYKYHAKIKMR